MKTSVAKNKLLTKPDGFTMPSSLEEELAAAIHGAFEAAVEVAVREVTKLFSVAAVGMYEQIRQENKMLKQELQKAQSFVIRPETGNDSPQNSRRRHASALEDFNVTTHNVYKKNGEETQPLLDNHHEKQAAGLYFESQGNVVEDLQPNGHSKDCFNDEQTKLSTSESKSTEINKVSRPSVSSDSAVKVKSTKRSCTSEEPQDPSVTTDSFIDKFAPEQIKVKEEKPEEAIDALNCLVDPFKEEEISQLQSEIIEEWKPGVSEFQSEEQNVSRGQPQDLNFNLEPCMDQSQILDFPNIIHLTDSAPVRPPAAQMSGGHVRSNRNLGHTTSNIHTCKSCGQTFPLPSLLRRHYGQCQQKLYQRHLVPVAGGKRPKLQLYPPGCSPFCCTVCNREFNRMENLKTHLRIHTGERPYKCSVCSTCFRHSGALTRHFRIHTGEKPYVCGVCGKRFRNCGGLKFHQRSHNK